MKATDKGKETRRLLTVAFRALRKAGYFARQNWQCCQGCGVAALPENTKKYVFYHAQDADRLRERGWTYLAWVGDGAEIVRICEDAGLLVQWGGLAEYRMRVAADRLAFRSGE